MRKLLATIAAALVVGSAAPTAHADTYTLEPFDFDDVVSMWRPTITQAQFGGSQCPCEKIPYPSTGLPWDNQKGADAIWSAVQADLLKPGDTLLGFSLGVQVISLFMSQHSLPAGVRLVLAGDTLARNQQLVDAGQGIPWDTPNPVVMVANEFDGYSDQPDVTSAPGYWTALINAALGTQKVHNYTNAELDNPNNVVTSRGNFTAILVPNQTMPNGDEASRASVDGAYSRPAPSQQQLDNAGPEQVTTPLEINTSPEPAAAIPAP